ncbi:helix-turn-helix DNA binding protein [Gordonia phage ASerpRocky]|uniref:Helix-turn-helix DNA binding protein n=1 Tax=Gordonia phage ASerpRocky TaxID=2599841 RepID=A0A5J6TDS4_9CAUD|nr:helix-turn-helix DNA binding protein [Gordonia phage ASerpRocky]UYL87073.1 helix-turn-helix DNA binding domain protein [Gordonia phage Hollow]
MTVQEAAKLLRVTDWTIRKHLRNGVYPGAIRPGRNWLIPRADVHAYFKKEYNK